MSIQILYNIIIVNKEDAFVQDFIVFSFIINDVKSAFYKNLKEKIMENTELISKAVHYAKKNFNNTDMSVENVADFAGFSIDYFNRIFLAHTGFTVMSYVNYMRIKKAVELLRNTDKTVLDIALEVGYDSHEGFIKAFKKIYNVTPSEYRKQNKSKVLSWNELTDSSCVNRFLHENCDFKQIDSDLIIDYLLEQDSKRYGYFCTTIKCMGLQIVAPSGNYEKGFIGIGDDRNGGVWLELVSDDFSLLAEWIKRFDSPINFYSNENPEKVRENLKSYGINCEIESTPQSLYLGDHIKNNLPQNVIIRELSYADKDNILKWANGKTDGYINHLLNEKHYQDPSVMEYGVFQNDDLIAIAGCGIDEAHGFKLNNCCNIRFADGKATNEMYFNIFAFVVNDIIDKGLLPFDDLQYGEYAKSHGGFSANDVGFTTVNWRYDIFK